MSNAADPLVGLHDVEWSKTHPNGDGADIPRELERWRAGQGFDGKFGSPAYVLADLLLHQGTRFGGAAEALPFLLRLAARSTTRERPFLLRLAAGIGAPVDEGLASLPFDRADYANMTDDELWGLEDDDMLNGFAAMCAHDGRKAWLNLLPEASRLVEDPDADVGLEAIVALSREGTAPAAHEGRLHAALEGDPMVAWHAALGLGHLAELGGQLRPDTVASLIARLKSAETVERATAAFALAFVAPDTPGVRAALRERESHFEELSAYECRFAQALTGMLARAEHSLE